MINVKVGALRAFKQQAFSGLDGCVTIHGCVGDVRGQHLGCIEHPEHCFLHGHFIHARGPQRLVVHDDPLAQFLLQNLRLCQENGTQAAPLHLVRIGWTDAASRGADLFVAAFRLTGDIQSLMVGHHQMCRVTDQKVFRCDLHALTTKFGHLFKQAKGVHHDAIADHANFAFPKDAAGDQVQDVFLTVADDGVSGIVSAGGTHDHVCVFREIIDNLAFSFIAPLGTDNYGIGHFRVFFARFHAAG